MLQVRMTEAVGITVASKYLKRPVNSTYMKLQGATDLSVSINISSHVPLIGIVAIRHHEVGHPFVDLISALQHQARDLGPDSEVNHQPLLLTLLAKGS